MCCIVVFTIGPIGIAARCTDTVARIGIACCTRSIGGASIGTAYTVRIATVRIATGTGGSMHSIESVGTAIVAMAIIATGTAIGITAHTMCGYGIGIGCIRGDGSAPLGSIATII